MMEASIIIPTYNRAEKLRSCLEALSKQTQPASDFEVIVVVDGSTDDTVEMLASLRDVFCAAGHPSSRILASPLR